MKLMTCILVLLGAFPAFAENLQVEITRKKLEHDGLHFIVVAEPERLMHNQFQIHQVVVAVRSTGQRKISEAAYIEVWDGGRFVYSSLLSACRLSEIPTSLQKKVPSDAVLFSFKINPAFLKRTWFNYQIPGEGEPTDCVIHLEEFMEKPNKPSEATP